MALVVPNVGEDIVLQKYLKNENLTLKLFSNNVTPGETDTAATYTVVVGGGYVDKTLIAGTWIITPGNPTIASYVQQTFTFTGVTSAPGTIYGYFVVDGANVLRWAERFPAANVPFAPITNSTIRITPKFECS